MRVDLGKVLGDGAGALIRNFVLMVPTIVASIAALYIAILTAGVKKGPEGLPGIILNLFAHGMTLAMAKEALSNGKTSIAIGFRGLLRHFPSFLIASTFMGIIIGAGLMLYVIPGLAAAFLLFFTFPSIIVDGAGPLKAIYRSYGIVRSNLKDSAIIFVVVMITGFFFRMLNTLVNLLPDVGHLIGAVLSGVFGAFIAAVAVSAYLAFREAHPSSGSG